MIDRRNPITDDELHAYVDGELPGDRRAEVDAWLAAHPEDMARVATWRAQAEAIRTRYGSVANEPVPARLGIARLMANERGWRSWRRVAAAAVIALILGGIGGWFARELWTVTPVVSATHGADDPLAAFTTGATDAYRLYVAEVRHPVEVTANDAEHLVQWLSKRVGYQLRAPNLEHIGFKLVGGRLLPGPTGAAAFFMYENMAGERYTLYCGRTRAPETALRYKDGTSPPVVYWANDDVVYVISGKGDRQQLQSVATAAHEQLEVRPSSGKGGG
ncbi:MAG TPA: anti-sigma factor [Xanthobacteraceae bacterium]|nr:anti-sigma factor [Xanthobacteraceae bacterium]